MGSGGGSEQGSSVDLYPLSLLSARYSVPPSKHLSTSTLSPQSYRTSNKMDGTPRTPPPAHRCTGAGSPSRLTPYPVSTSFSATRVTL